MVNTDFTANVGNENMQTSVRGKSFCIISRCNMPNNLNMKELRFKR